MGWPIYAIGDVCKVISGGTPKSGILEYWDGKVNWITPKDMGQLEDVYVSVTSRTISEKGLLKSSAKLVPANSVILSTRAPIGHLVINSVPMATNQGCRGLVPDQQKLITKYLFYYLLSKVDLLNELGSGTTFKELSKTALEKVSIPVPGLNEQKRIVAMLDEAFADIDKARELTEQNIKNARELFDSYLQRVFTEGISWRKFGLNEIAIDFGRGKSKHRPRNDPSLYDGKFPFIQTGDVRNSRHYISSFSKTYNEKGRAQSKLWPIGTICITIAANIAETGVLDFEACFPDSVIGLVVNPELAHSRYVEFLLQSFKRSLQAEGKGSAQDNINLATFESLKFPFPSIEKQIEIVRDLDELMKRSEDLENIYLKKLERLDNLKKTLLRKLFRG